MDEKFKWKIINITVNNGKMRLVVDFGYGWKEIMEEDEEGNEIVRYEGKTQRETLEVPAILSKDQIIEYLNLHWANKYGPLDALEQALSGIAQLKGYVEKL